MRKLSRYALGVSLSALASTFAKADLYIPPPVISVQPQASSVDMSTVINTAFGSGGVAVKLACGNFYVTNPILTPSNVDLGGSGPCTNLIGNSNLAQNPQWIAVGGTVRNIVSNSAFVAGNANIQFHDMNVSLPSSPGNAHLATFYNVAGVQAWNLTFTGDGTSATQDGISFPGSSNYRAHHIVGTGVSNACIDEWQGASNFDVHDNICVGASVAHYGVLVNALTTVSPTQISPGAYVVNTAYIITVAGAGGFNFTSVGAANNNVGTGFTATAAGSGGTGSAVVNEPVATTTQNGSVHDNISSNTTGPGVFVAGLCGGSVSVGSFIVGSQYTITTPGAGGFLFTSIGAANNNAGTVFVATGVGSGGTGAASVCGIDQAITVRGNTVAGTTSGNPGIAVRDSQDISVSGNIVESAGGDCIQVQSQLALGVTKNISIVGNPLDGCGGNGVTLGNGASYVQVTDNPMAGTISGYNIAIAASVSNSSIRAGSMVSGVSGVISNASTTTSEVAMNGTTMQLLSPGVMQFGDQGTLNLWGLDSGGNWIPGSGNSRLLGSSSNYLKGAYGAAWIVSGTPPTLTTGSCSGSSATGGATGGGFTAATCAGGTYILSGMPTVPNGYSCWAYDETTSTDTLKPTAHSTTSITFTATTVSGDSIRWGCSPS